MSNVKYISAPYGGLNARDGLSEMAEKDAVRMDNFFPAADGVSLRNGSIDHATGIAGQVNSLLSYYGNTPQLFACHSDKITNATAVGAVGAASVSGLTSSYFQYVNFGNIGGFFLLAVNGNDDLQSYNGTTWTAINALSTPAITGVATNSIINITSFKNRIWLLKQDSLKAWYLPVASIGGTANLFDLSGIFKQGGYLVTATNWTLQSGQGIDDYFAFITSNGEVAVYSGVDPTSVTDWQLVGLFRIPSPIGYRCVTKVGNDVFIITVDGVISLSQALQIDMNGESKAISDKIRNLFNNDAVAYKSNLGWEIILHPAGKKILCNVPEVTNNNQFQYVYSIEKTAWCKYSGWNANCFALHKDRLFYGTNGKVIECDVGKSDNGLEIMGVVQQAYINYGSSGQKKQFLMAQAIISSETQLNPSLIMNIDYDEKRTINQGNYTINSSNAWDISPWDTTSWGFDKLINSNWQSLSGVGYVGGLRFVISAKNLTCKWQATNVLFKKGTLF